MRRESITFFAAVITILCVTVFVSTATGALWYAPDTEVPVPAETEELRERTALPEDYPARLRIPTLGVDAYVQEVGVNAKGNMAAPNNFTDVGWYKHGTVPGFVGSAVVAGHVDNGLSLPGVFKNLNSIHIGDDIFLEKKDGGELRFRVTEIQTYPYAHVPLKVLFSRRDIPRLNLVTCEGDWIPSNKMYDQRLIVYTELVE